MTVQTVWHVATTQVDADHPHVLRKLKTFRSNGFSQMHRFCAKPFTSKEGYAQNLAASVLE